MPRLQDARCAHRRHGTGSLSSASHQQRPRLQARTRDPTAPIGVTVKSAAGLERSGWPLRPASGHLDQRVGTWRTIALSDDCIIYRLPFLGAKGAFGFIPGQISLQTPPKCVGRTQNTDFGRRPHPKHGLWASTAPKTRPLGLGRTNTRPLGLGHHPNTDLGRRPHPKHGLWRRPPQNTDQMRRPPPKHGPRASATSKSRTLAAVTGAR